MARKYSSTVICPSELRFFYPNSQHAGFRYCPYCGHKLVSISEFRYVGAPSPHRAKRIFASPEEYAQKIIEDIEIIAEYNEAYYSF